MKDDALFCVGQKAFIEKEGKVLILHDPVEGLDFPGGKIQEGEAQGRGRLKYHSVAPTGGSQIRTSK